MKATHRLYWRLAAGALAGALFATGACSLIVNTTSDQCKTDADCKALGTYSMCSSGICVKPTSGTGSSSASSGTGGDAGCFNGTPTTDPQFFNHCTDGGCEPFDNCARLNLCNGAPLPDLVVPPDGGVQ